jgi:uncharacterized tellurite resistance protein B-like protein
MIDIVKKFFGKTGKRAEKEVDSGHDVRVATCALLIEMGNIDGEFSEEEQEHLINNLKGEYGLSDENIKELMKTAHRELDGSIDLWRFTNLINQNYSHDEKNRIMEMVWRVVYADGKLDKHEDYLVRKMAALLRLSHKEMIDAKLKVLGKS